MAQAAAQVKISRRAPCGARDPLPQRAADTLFATPAAEARDSRDTPMNRRCVSVRPLGQYD
jgi:hypothetical protein